MLWTTKAFLLRFLSTILMISCSLIFFLVSLIRCTRLRFPFHFFSCFFSIRLRFWLLLFMSFFLITSRFCTFFSSTLCVFCCCYFCLFIVFYQSSILSSSVRVFVFISACYVLLLICLSRFCPLFFLFISSCSSIKLRFSSSLVCTLTFYSFLSSRSKLNFSYLLSESFFSNCSPFGYKIKNVWVDNYWRIFSLRSCEVTGESKEKTQLSE